MTAIPTRPDVKQTRVQVARGWPATDDGWETLRGVWAEDGSEGAGAIVGEMTLRQVFGVVLQPGDAAVYQWGIAPDYRGEDETSELTDRYVRVLLEDEDGTVSIDDRTFTAFWWGLVGARVLEPDGAEDYPGGSATWPCIGIAMLLDRVFITRGYEVAADGVTVIDPGYCPTFNDLPFGDSTDAQIAMGNGSTYIFDRGGAGIKDRWQALDVINLLLAGYAQPSLDGVVCGGLAWLIGTGSTLLEYDAPRLEAHGRTVFEVLNLLINPRRGLTWRTRVEGSYAYIDVSSTSEETITVGSATVTAATQVDVDVVDDVWKQQVQVVQDPVAFDHMRGFGSHPLLAMTLEFKAGSAGATYALVPSGFAPSDIPGDDPSEMTIWRQWRINPAWQGSNYNNTPGLRHVLAADGTRTYSASGNPQAAVLRLDRLTPLGAGCTANADGPRNEPIIMIGSGSAWVDYSAEISLTVTENPAGITLGSSASDALRLKALLEDGTKSLLITIGVYEWSPLQTYWTRPVEDWPRDVPRVWNRTRADIVQRLGLVGTVHGCPLGVLQVQGIQTMVRDDLPVLQAEQALAQARYGGTGGGNASWSEGGTIDIDDTYAPGVFIGHLSNGDRTFRVMAPIVRRGWSFRAESYGTSYRTERTAADIEARP